MKVDFLNTMDGPNPPLHEMGLYCSANNNYIAMPINFSDKFNLGRFKWIFICKGNE